MSLVDLLSMPMNTDDMKLAYRRETKDEGYSPGLRVFDGDMPGQSILLNATYNNYTISNHYESTEQEEMIEKLKQKNKDLTILHKNKCNEFELYERKYACMKRLLLQAVSLVHALPDDARSIDKETRSKLTTFKEKWANNANIHRKRKVEDVDDDDDVQCKKQKTC